MVLQPLRAEICFHDIWDAKTASFAPCFLPVIVALPTLLAAVILFGQSLRFLIRARPQWMRPFVQETAEPVVEVDLVRTRRWTGFTVALIAIAAVGTLLQVATSVTGWSRLYLYLPILPWLVILSELVILRPRTVPYAALWLLVVQLATQVTFARNEGRTNTTHQVFEYLTIATDVIGISVLLFMPLRDPFWPIKGISKPFSEPQSISRSPEDLMNLWQFMTVAWMSPMLKLAKVRQLEETDVWALPHDFQHQLLHDRFRELKGTVIRRLVVANAIDIIIIIFLGLIELVATYAAPVLLQLILSSMEDPHISNSVPVAYAFLVLFTRLLNGQIGVFTLWFGRRCYERSRGEMITMLHEKTLARKIAFQSPPDEKKKNAADENGSANGHANGHSDTPAKPTPSWWSRLKARLGFSKKPEPVKEPASMGKILNLMRNDVYEVAQRFWEVDKLVRVPLSVLFSMTLVVNYLGWSSMIAVAVVVGAQLISAALARLMILIEKKRRVATDKKLAIVGQFVEALRHLRWYGWQAAWLEKVLTARQAELTLRLLSSAVNIVIAFVNTLSLDVTPVVAFFAYTMIAHRRLTVDIAFPAQQLFGMMTFALNELPQLITTLINAWVAVDRIEEFMAEPDREENATEALVGDQLALYRATFAWPGTEKPVLKDLTLSFPEGMTVITGEVASGKTALLQALLGELDMLPTGGQLLRPQEPIGYCAQTPWLQSMSIRENILFSEFYDTERYAAVIEACALVPDFAEFKGGDEAMIGENGIGLSGGQRARVALARAVYSQSRILFLDDPLSALDQQTAEAIVEKCFRGPLMEGRVVLLVTHRSELVAGSAVQVVRIKDGEAELVDRETAIKESGAEVPPMEGDAKREDGKDAAVVAANGKKVVPTAIVNKAAADKFMDDEHREAGAVKLGVYWAYIKAGTFTFWGLLIFNLLIFRGFITAEAWFLKTWGEAYNTQSTAFHIDVFYSNEQPVVAQDWISDHLPPPEENPRPWLLILLGLALGQSVGFVLTQAMVILLVYTAGKNMFRQVMQRVAGATFRFYDVTPVGRLMNRMTSDIGVIDGGISMQLMAISWMVIGWVTAVVIIAAITPPFLVLTIVLAVLFVVIFRQFITASQSLRRLEMVSLTPLMSNFGALLEGLATVRAFRAQERFQQRVIHVVDTFQKMDHFYWSAQAWITYRYDMLSACSTFLLFILALATGLSPGLTAFALLSAQRFVQTTHALCKRLGQLQMEFVSVERVVELLHLEQEDPGTVAPPAWWPSFAGDIVYDHVTLRYAPHLPPALADVSFTIRGSSKTAILGRTGSGKSTLALSLLATLLPSEGAITLDGFDLATVDRQLLRSRITFLAQDPVLFPGTMRENLDPVAEHTDEACAGVLTRVCARQGWTLDTKVEAGGKNLSQGQRQLVGLARAVLRRSAVVILDEATASIDRETAAQIQDVMQEEMKESTVITIAHRLEAVRNADYCIVLGKGKVVEQGPAEEMLRKKREVVEAEVGQEDEEGGEGDSGDGGSANKDDQGESAKHDYGK